MEYQVFFDFRCPYVYRAALLLRRTGRRPRWRFFSLARANGEEDGRDLDDPETVRAAAGAIGLDLDAFERDLADPGIQDAVRRDHDEAVELYRVFGTPTFVGPDGSAAYVRLREVPDGPEAERAIAMIEDVLE